MIRRGIDFDSTDNEENVERVGADDQHLMGIDASVNVEDIPADPSTQS